MRYFNKRSGPFLLWSSALLAASTALAADRPLVAFRSLAGRVEIRVGDEPFAHYVYRDDKISRPYFAHVHAPGGVRISRNHPPIDRQDPTDHATYHPGLWLAFGDLGGADDWRNRAAVRHEIFVAAPTGGPGRGTFTVRNRYLSAGGDMTIAQETCRFTLLVRPYGTLLLWDSEFRAAGKRFAFGDQEEMGLGIRVATPLSVIKGGRIRSSEGRTNEEEVWGRQADWCDYSGVVNGRRLGVVLMPAPSNFRRSWFHARDYGLLVANPFGRNAFTRGPASRVVVEPDEPFHLRFGVALYNTSAERPINLPDAYRDFLEQLRSSPK